MPRAGDTPTRAEPSGLLVPVLLTALAVAVVNLLTAYVIARALGLVAGPGAAASELWAAFALALTVVAAAWLSWRQFLRARRSPPQR